MKKDVNVLHRVLQAPQAEFTEKVNKIREEYFEKDKGEEGLSILDGNDQFEVCFHIDYDLIKEQE